MISICFYPHFRDSLMAGMASTRNESYLMESGSMHLRRCMGHKSMWILSDLSFLRYPALSLPVSNSSSSRSAGVRGRKPMISFSTFQRACSVRLITSIFRIKDEMASSPEWQTLRRCVRLFCEICP